MLRCQEAWRNFPPAPDQSLLSIFGERDFHNSVFSKLYACKSLHLSPVHCVRYGWKWIHSHWHDKAHSRHDAPPTAHWGEIAGFLPHTDQMQVQGNTTELDRQKRTTITSQIIKYYQEWSASKIEKYRVSTFCVMCEKSPGLCLILSANIGCCHCQCISMWWHELLCLEWTCASVTAWLMWLHTLCVIRPLWRSHLDNEESLLASWNTPALCAHALWCSHHSQRMLRAGFAIMVFLITGAAWF